MSTIRANQWLNLDGTENYKCRAWVNFNGTGTVAIRASGNVASITDNGAGDYTVNFITPMPDANYVGQINAGLNGASNNVVSQAHQTVAQTASAYRIQTIIPNTGALVDAVQAHVSIFR